MKHSWYDKHVAHTGKSLLKALYATLGVFLFFFVAFHIGNAFQTSFFSKQEASIFNEGIATEKKYLKEQGDIVSKENAFIDALVSKNHDPVLTILQNERTARGVGLMAATDEKGFVIGRTISPGRFADNVFLTAPAGRAVAQGKSTQSIEVTSSKNQIFMTTVRPVMRDGNVVGALFASNLFDDAFASRFKNTYLSDGTEVVFYTKEYGVYGNSFSDQNLRTLISSYFNTGSDWIKNGETDKTITFDNASSYLVQNIPLQGLEGVSGGALIFTPRNDISLIANGITAFFTFCIFLILALRHHIYTSRDERGWRYYIMLFGAAIPVFILSFFALYSQNIGRLHLEHIPYTLYNSTIRMQPDFGIYSVGFEQHVTVVVDTGDEPINVVQLNLTFDPGAVEVKALSVASTSCSYVVENIINQTLGTARLTCGILNSKTGQQSIPVVDVTIVPRRTGTFTLSFDQSNTEVLAADGLGTNVLRSSQSGSYRVDDFDPALDDEDVSATTTGRTFMVFSPSHSNESRWYNLKEVNFVWVGKSNDVYRYAFDSSPTTVPSGNHIIQGNGLSLQIPGDGIYYFHLQLASGGPIAHYQIRSDRTPPRILGLNLSKDSIVEGDVVRFSFDAEDLASGIQHNYYVDLGNHLFLPIGQDLFVPFLDAGDQPITLRVYDNAGNYSELKKIIHVEAK